MLIALIIYKGKDMFQKYNSLAIIVICTMFLLVACSKSDKELKNIQQADYLVSYSNAMKDGGYIYAYDKKGNTISKMEVDGQSMMSTQKMKRILLFIK